MTEPDWPAIAAALCLVARSAGCRCEFERTKGGVPIWFPDDHGGIGRKLIKRCSRCIALERYDEALELTA